MGDEYNHVLDNMDAAGYWHTLPAFGQIKAEGLFSDVDLQILNTNNRMFETARNTGLLLQGKGNTFVWKEGIGPFSQQWLTMAGPLQYLP